MTAARIRGSKTIRSNSQRGIKRLDGLLPVVEDWHAKGCLLTVSIHVMCLITTHSCVLLYIQQLYMRFVYDTQAIWKRLYKCSSSTDQGTLYQLRNLIDRRNVVTKPIKAVDACEDFLICVVEAHILAAAMDVFGMDSVDSKPSDVSFRIRCIVIGRKEKVASSGCW